MSYYFLPYSHWLAAVLMQQSSGALGFCAKTGTLKSDNCSHTWWYTANLLALICGCKRFSPEHLTEPGNVWTTLFHPVRRSASDSRGIKLHMAHHELLIVDLRRMCLLSLVSYIIHEYAYVLYICPISISICLWIKTELENIWASKFTKRKTPLFC